MNSLLGSFLLGLLFLHCLCTVGSLRARPSCLQRRAISCTAVLKSLAAEDYTDEFLRTNRLKMVKHIDNQILHFEFFHQRWPTFILKLILRLPKMVRKFLQLKPTAKTGVRLYSASSLEMDELVRGLFLAEKFFEETTSRVKKQPPQPVSTEAEDRTNSVTNSDREESPENESGQLKVGLFVYMWVNPRRRGEAIGEYLLDLCRDYCRRKGDGYMLLVHDDKGSSKLVKYYSQRGFISVDYFLKKGMICRL